MYIVDLSSLTPNQLADYQRRYQSNLLLYDLTEAQALQGNGGMVARVAAVCAFNDVRNRRQLPGRTR